MILINNFDLCKKASRRTPALARGAPFESFENRKLLINVINAFFMFTSHLHANLDVS